MSRLLRGFFLPPGLFCEALLLIVWLGPRRPGWARALAIGLALTIYLLSTSLVCDALHDGLRQAPPLTLEQARASRAQAIVCLASGGIELQPELGRSGLGDDSLVRTYYAVALQRATGLPILFSGGAWKNFSIAQPMAEAAQAMGIRPELLWVEPRSQDTWQNARFSAEFLQARGVRRVLLITQCWHMRRAVYAFSRTPLEAVPAPYESHFTTPLDTGLIRWIPNRHCLSLSSRVLEEWLGLVFYAFKQ